MLLQGALGLLAIPPAGLIVLGFVIYELKTNDVCSDKNNKVRPCNWSLCCFCYVTVSKYGYFLCYCDTKNDKNLIGKFKKKKIKMIELWTCMKDDSS